MKPPLDTLGPCAQLTVYEHALRTAQQTIDELRAQVKKLEGELGARYREYSERGFRAKLAEALGRPFEPPLDPPHACHPAQRVPVVPEPHEL